ncbi:hypothetical protein DPMN_129878 [Dreissena polymorpha]|uniref:Novel STAND NTPase 3 domain-containing protein n=2 Tax=Dreissena polymorpha TaxID=45954 RepID=A0A9D4K0Y2_DREPO|nr:hypothetical protein DPMN_129878 [Dreissena polymorpha]
MLTDKSLTVLTGHPGEGKTTMAAYLALQRSKPENCLKLAHASDWRKVDWSLKLFNTVIIDDIFGAGALNTTYLADWKTYLPEIERAAKAKRLNVIITSRHYIKEEALDDLNNNSIFKDKEGNIVHLASDGLTNEEKRDILRLQVKRTDTEHLLFENQVDIDECVLKSKGTMNLDFARTENFVFGFPQCANLFVQSEKIIIKFGAQFFENPEAHFKAYIEQLYNPKDDDIFHKFIALVSVWAEQTGRIKADHVRSPSSASDHIKFVANIFDIKVDRKFMENISSSLKSHQKDFLIYLDHSGEYKFSHNVIGDMVGVVLGDPRHKIVETIELCPRDFLMDRIRLDDEAADDEFRVIVGKDNYHHLCKKVAKMILRKDCNKIGREDYSHEFQLLQRKGPRSNTIEVLHDLDFGILKHPIFQNKHFVGVFMKVIKDDGLEQDIFRQPVMKMTGYFLDYGIRMNEMTMCIPGYTLYSKISVLANALIENNFIQKDHTDPLLLAAHSGDLEMIKLLLSKGAKVSGDTIYVAMHKKRRPDQNCLKIILQYPGIAINDRGNAINGNYPLIVASKKGFHDAVKCMLENGADPGVQNDKNLTALHKAVIYKHTDIVQELLKHGAPLDIKGGKFKRTPLHIAADVGNMALVKSLLSKGANVEVKDHRGHYPIFLAAIQGHTATVEALLQHERKQDQLRIKSYGKASKIKGMSLFHVAVWKKDKDLMEMLIREKADPNVKDFFGQTALFFAIMHDCKPMIKCLLPYGDKAIQQKQGFTPLHAAVFKGNAKTTSQLAVNVDVNARDKYGRTPLHVACEKGDIQIANLLLNKYKADHRMITKRGDSVYHILRRKKLNQTNDEHCKRRLIEILISTIDPTFIESISNKSNRSGISIDKKTMLTASDKAVIEGLITTLSIEKCEESDEEEAHEQSSKGSPPKKPKTGRRSPDFLDSDDDDNYDDDPLQYLDFGSPLDYDEYDDDGDIF